MGSLNGLSATASFVLLAAMLLFVMLEQRVKGLAAMTATGDNWMLTT